MAAERGGAVKKGPGDGAKYLKEECATKHGAIITQTSIEKYNDRMFALSLYYCLACWWNR